MNVSTRKSVVQSLLAIVVAGVFAGCAAATANQRALVGHTSDGQTGSAGEKPNRVSKLAEAVEDCLHNAIEGDRHFGDVQGLLQTCIGPTKSRETTIMAAHAALLLIANYGERSIRVFKHEDLTAASGDAAVLKSRVVRAREQLTKFKEAPAPANFVFWPRYGAAIDSNNLNFSNVARAALAPVIRRSKVTVRQYIAASAGAATGVLERVFERRETIARKVQFVKETVDRAETALTEARCAIEYVDRPPAGTATSNVPERQVACEDFKKFDGASKSDPAEAHWNETEQLLNRTIESLDRIINDDAESA